MCKLHVLHILPVHYRRRSTAKEVELLTATPVSTVRKVANFLHNYGAAIVSPTSAFIIYSASSAHHQFIIVVILMERHGLKWHVSFALIVFLYAERRNVYC